MLNSSLSNAQSTHIPSLPRPLRSPHLVLDLLLDIIDGVTGLDIEGDGLSREGLDENLHFVG